MENLVSIRLELGINTQRMIQQEMMLSGIMSCINFYII